MKITINLPFGWYTFWRNYDWQIHLSLIVMIAASLWCSGFFAGRRSKPVDNAAIAAAALRAMADSIEQNKEIRR